MPGSEENTDSLTTRIGRGLRELVAAGFWTYTLLKLFVFDVDVYAITHIAPSFQWILKAKIGLWLGSLLLSFFALGWKKFLGTLLYLFSYPLIVLFWKLPVFLLKRWSLLLAFAPVLHRFISTFPATALRYTLATLSGVIILTSSSRVLLNVAMGTFAGFLLIHLYRIFRNAYSVSVMSGLTSSLRKFRDMIQRGMFDHPQASTPSRATGAADTKMRRDPSSLYVLRSLADIIVDKVRWTARCRKYHLYLVTTCLFTVGITSLVFAFEFLALKRLDISSFAIGGKSGGFWEFAGFSLGTLIHGGISTITASSRAAILLSYGEAICGLLVLVILVAELTAARESYKSDMDEFSTELEIVAEALDHRLTQVYCMTLIEVELFLLPDKAPLVNGLRKARGLQELPTPPLNASAPSAQPDSVSGADPHPA